MHQLISLSENEFLRSAFNLDSNIWLGGASVGGSDLFAWSAGPSTSQSFWRGDQNGNKTSPRSEVNWAPGQPQNSDEQKFCVAANSSLFWQSENCEMELYTIVEFEPRGQLTLTNLFNECQHLLLSLRAPLQLLMVTHACFVG